MMAGVIDKLSLLAGSTAEELSPQSGRTALEQGPEGAPMSRRDALSKVPFILRPVAPKDFSQFEHWLN